MSSPRPGALDSGGQSDAPRPGTGRWQAGHVVAERVRLLRPLGAGAMGEVWCAFDLELDETVALKRLRDDAAAEARMAELFRREVRLARRVAHRNVARVFELVVIKGPAGPQLSLTMEYVRGVTLSQLLRSQRRCEAAAVVHILREACAGLGAVHEAGVVHRDIKPGNVMLGEGDRVVLMDFGVALPARDAPGERGSLTGTPAYMAPELFDGAAATVASDVYALGCLGYELVTGRRAFDGGDVLSMMAQKTQRLAAPEIDELPGLAALIATCLEPEPSARFASAADLSAALARLGAPTSVVLRPGPPAPDAPEPGSSERERPQLAVVPLEPDGVGVGLAELLAEDFVGELSRHKALRVLAPAAVRRLRVEGRGPAAWVEAGRALGASAVVGGVARAEGADLGLTLHAISVPEGDTLWRWRGRVTLDERLPSMGQAAQSFLASPYVAALGRVPAAAEPGSSGREAAGAPSPTGPWAAGAPSPSRPSTAGASSPSRPSTAGGTLILQPLEADPDEAPTRVRGGEPPVLDLFLRARALAFSPSSRDVDEGIRCFEAAMAIAPDDPRIASGLAVALVRYLFQAPAGVGGLVERAERAAEHALKLAPSMGEPHHARASILLHQGRPVEAVRSLRRALRCSPSLAAAHLLLGQLLLEADHADEGRRRLTTAERLEPGNLEVVWSLYRAAVLDGREAEVADLRERLRRIGGLRTYWSLQLRTAA
ncbi:MAG TPA: protein kinase, partial [Polyangiaceae bacterium]|nr:protein kinase [Polyangiaceae bacterium]